MTALQKIHPAYEEDTDNQSANDRAVVVTLLGSNIPAAYLDEAEPSPLMETASRWWQRFLFSVRLALVLTLVGGYPLMMALSHKVDSRPVIYSDGVEWSSPETVTALTLIGREETGPGWAMDRAWWRPQAQLIALPAWQEGLTAGLSDYMLLTAQTAAPDSLAPDADLMAAGRLLAPVADAPAKPRMRAAAEALQRYDGRLARGLATAPTGKDGLGKELDLFIAWSASAEASLRNVPESNSGWPASRAHIEAIYKARGQAQAASQMLGATLAAEPSVTASREISEAKDAALMAWRQAANFSPLFVSSPGETAGLLSDHPATMAWYMSEARRTTQTLKDSLAKEANGPDLIAALTP